VERILSLIAVVALPMIAVIFSSDRKKINWRLVGTGIALQFVFALLVLKTGPGRDFFGFIGSSASELMKIGDAGSGFVFGKLTDPSGAWGFLFAFKVLPTIVFFASLTSVLYYLGIMQMIVSVISKVIGRLLGTSGAETLCASANIFMGQTEAPLLIKPYITGLTRSELMVVMVSGFGTLAAGIMLIYAGMMEAFLPSAAGHLLAASVMSCPATILMAKIFVPETEEPETRAGVSAELTKTESSVIEAAAVGASGGMSLALNVGAMLIAFVALVAMINIILAKLSSGAVSLEIIFGYLFAPLAFLIGIPQADLLSVGGLMGKNLVINEFIAFSDLGTLLTKGGVTGRSAAMMMYVLCGFSNLSSVAIQIGGIGAMAETRRSDLAKLGFTALLAATLANLQTAAIVGTLLSEDDCKLAPVKPISAPPAPSSTPSAAPTVSASPTPSPTATP
jgi:CNT family concentrative nucleoside transporter